MKSKQSTSRKGTIAVLSAVVLVFLLFVVAFVVDIGYVMNSKAEAQLAADAAAHAAAMEYRISGDVLSAISAARSTAAEYSLSNRIASQGSEIDQNEGNLCVLG